MFTGTWRVVSSPDLDDDYLELQPEGEPHVTFRRRGNRIEGSYEIGLLTGEIDGRLRGEQLVFSFAGMDEMDEVSGSGIAVVIDNRLTLTLMYHLGDDYTFECERVG
jgi:hypothetical protein